MEKADYELDIRDMIISMARLKLARTFRGIKANQVLEVLGLDENTRSDLRFSRVKNKQTRDIVGTGLGLPIVKGIVDARNGRIEVESQVGQGSTFSVFIPIA